MEQIEYNVYISTNAQKDNSVLVFPFLLILTESRKSYNDSHLIEGMFCHGQNSI